MSTARHPQEIVQAKYPEAYCNAIWKIKARKKHLQFWICTGVYQDQRSLGRLKDDPESAWADAARHIYEEE